MRFRNALLLVLLATVSSCGKDKPAADIPTAPTPAPTVPANTYKISGNVRTPGGQPAAGIRVSVGSTKLSALSVDTDAQGHFEGHVVAGTFDVFLTKLGYESVVVVNGMKIPDQSQIDFTFPMQISLFGTITELGVGRLGGVKVEIVSGPNAGRSVVSSDLGDGGLYSIAHIEPGDMTIRASKSGYETIERAVTLSGLSGIDFTMRWAYGSCLNSVSRVLLDNYQSTGGRETVAVNANPGRTWSAVPDSPWIEVLSSHDQTGPGELVLRVHEYPVGGTTPRRGAVQLRCGPGEGQNVWINQLPNCQIQLAATADTPSLFTAVGGVGHLSVQGASSCRWQFNSYESWMTTAGVRNSSGNGGVTFLVQPNTTGVSRAGRLAVNDTEFLVSQQP